jgi:hypothetical protein
MGIEHQEVLHTSLNHKIFGRFAETWDNAVQMGYLRIEWDIFDVAKEFPSDYWENGLMKDGTPVKDIAGIEKLKKFSKGHTGDPEGWIGVENAVIGA